jgi:S-methylmethionine-dependent homocysteine/selenocysteine methylase
VNAPALPQLGGRPMVTDGGMETDLIFHHGVDLPLFAAFPLIDSRHRPLADDLPALAIVGGCCGTDARHVEALWT